MQAFAYSNSPYQIRTDLAEAYRHAWQAIAQPGTWWTGAERVAIAAEMRNARTCTVCADRKAALSPFADDAVAHDSSAELPAKVVDIVHRLTTDPSRLTQTWLEQQISADFSYGQYVEIISVIVSTLCIDTFHNALGYDLEPLPVPQTGAPSSYVPSSIEHSIAWVPIIDRLDEAESDLWDEGRKANVIAALSLVPDAVRLLKRLSGAQYLAMQDVPNPTTNGGRAISRPQIEFIAARVSALNDCFY